MFLPTIQDSSLTTNRNILNSIFLVPISPRVVRQMFVKLALVEVGPDKQSEGLDVQSENYTSGGVSWKKDLQCEDIVLARRSRSPTARIFRPSFCKPEVRTPPLGG